MATITSNQSGAWATTTTWVGGVVPANGDTVIIASGHQVRFNVDQSGFTNGLASLTINGVLHMSCTAQYCLKMNGNITGPGLLLGGYYMTAVGEGCTWTQLSGYNNIYYGLYSGVYYGFTDTATQKIQAVWENIANQYVEVTSLSALDNTPSSYMRVKDSSGYEGVYLHTSTGGNPSVTNPVIIKGIDRPASGNSYNLQIIFNNTTSTVTVANMLMYGWYPNLEYSTLSAVASLNATQIVLNDDLGLNPGDKIIIGSGSENYHMAESNKGIYTVSSYNSTTKTVTLTSGLQTARLLGDYVSIFTRPINISHINENTSLIPSATILNNVVFKGVYLTNITLTQNYANTLLNWLFQHCTFYFNGNDTGGPMVMGVNGIIINDCLSNRNIYTFGNNINIAFNRCIFINDENDGEYNQISVHNNCIIQNCWAGTDTNHNSCIFKNNGGAIEYSYGSVGHLPSIYKNCIINSGNIIANALKNCSVIFNGCTFLDNTTNHSVSGMTSLSAGYLASMAGKLYNCLFTGSQVSNLTLEPLRLVNEIIESFDHNQIIGNYAAWMKGGSIVTQTISSVPQPGKLTFNPVSSTIPVYRDFKILAPANRVIRELITVNKSFSGGTVALQIIDPANDPLIDSTQTPLAQSTLPDTANTTLQLGIAYKSSVAKELILRVLVQSASGTANIDVTRIQQSFQKQNKLI